ncbi:MAG: methyltransferase domain-containing protein [Acidobacteria bacterium]|nr:methyltransferase domain-containing protein [Acidobacteriota bacterium]
MKFTGEQVVPREVDPDLFNEHRARYLFARQFVSGKKVLDAACGTGYGSALLGETATAVFGVDISSDAVLYARQHYRGTNLHFGRCDCLALAFPSGWFDVVVAFEIIEHLENPEAFVAELRRVLAPSGVLLLSTPNRLYYTEERGEVNPFHQREFSFPELQQLLSAIFPHCAILFENHVPGLLISDDSAPGPAVAAVAEQPAGAASPPENAQTAHYFVALCSNLPLEPTPPLLLLPSTGNVLREREVHIRRLTDYLAEARRDLEKLRADAEQREKEISRLLEERTQWALSLQEDVERARSALQKLHQELEERTAWALNLDQDVQHARETIRKLQQEMEERTAWALNLDQDLQQAREIIRKLQQEMEERTAWALNLEAELQNRCADLQLLYGSPWYRIGKTLHLGPVPLSDTKASDTPQR